MAKKMFKLDSTQINFLKEFSKSPLKNQFYWTGGTALAYFHLQHRVSLDIDFFSDEKFNYEDVIKFIRHFSQKYGLKNIEEKKIYDRWEFFLKNGKTIRVEFVHYDFKPLKSRKKWQDILIDSLDDMAANKTLAMIDRNEPKDIFDIYFLLTKSKFTPKKLLNLVKKKFGIDFSLSLFWAEALTKAKRLSVLKPLLLTSNQEKLINEIKKFIKNESVKTIKILIE